MSEMKTANEDFIKNLIPFYYKEIFLHMFALVTFANDIHEKYPEEAEAVFREMEDPKPKDLDTLIISATTLMAEITLDEEF
jgi:hypothetical protein